MTAIGEYPITQIIDFKRSRFTKSFYFQSDILKRDCIIPIGFEMDWESVPIIKGTSKIAGAIHDYLCRIDSDPVVTKKIAADVYKEFLVFRGASWWRWRAKYWAVRIAIGYFHKMRVLDKLKG
jgi:hypothetical protein